MQLPACAIYSPTKFVKMATQTRLSPTFSPSPSKPCAAQGTPAFSYFLGIDFSKETLDLCLIDLSGKAILKSFKVKNSIAGFARIERKLNARSGALKLVDKANLMIIGENTGRLSQLIPLLFSRNGWQFWLENPIEIKYSSGMTRGKSDAADAQQIARYGMRYQDQFQVYEPPTNVLVELDVQMKQLAKCERQLKSLKTSYEAITSSLTHFDIVQDEQVEASYQQLIEQMQAHINLLEKKIWALIKTDVKLKKQAKLLQSIPGIGPKTAVALIVYTRGFTRLTSASKLKCYCGVAPFEYQSGSSVRGRTKVHPNANKHLKWLLHMCAMTASWTKGELKDYYDRKVAQGKNRMLVMNNLRAKLIERIIAVIKRGTPFNKQTQVLTLS